MCCPAQRIVYLSVSLSPSLTYHYIRSGSWWSIVAIKQWFTIRQMCVYAVRMHDIFWTCARFHGPVVISYWSICRTCTMRNAHEAICKDSNRNNLFDLNSTSKHSGTCGKLCGRTHVSNKINKYIGSKLIATNGWHSMKFFNHWIHALSALFASSGLCYHHQCYVQIVTPAVVVFKSCNFAQTQKRLVNHMDTINIVAHMHNCLVVRCIRFWYSVCRRASNQKIPNILSKAWIHSFFLFFLSLQFSVYFHLCLTLVSYLYTCINDGGGKRGRSFSRPSYDTNMNIKQLLL